MPTARRVLAQARYEAGLSYTLRVAPSALVRDGFGLPLQAASTTFTMRALASLFEPPDTSSAAVRFAVGPGRAIPAAWPALVRAAGVPSPATPASAEAAARGVDLALLGPRDEDVRGAIAWLHYSARGREAGRTRWAALARGGGTRLAARPSEPAAGEGEAGEGEARLARALLGLPRGGLLLTSTSRGQWSGDAALLSAGELGVALLAVPDGSLLAWVLNTTSNAPVAGAAVQLYSWSCWSCEPRDVAAAERGVTDADGLLVLAPRARRSERLAALVTAPGGGGAAGGAPAERVLVETSRASPPAAEEPLRAVLLTDRALYRANESVRLKGYVRRPRLAELSIPRGEFRLSVRWGAPGSQGGAASTLYTPVALGGKHGSLDAELRVPPDASYTEHSVALQGKAEGERSFRTLATAAFAIADPRPPTAELTVATPGARVLLPGGGVPLLVRTISLSGVPVSGAEVVLRWSLERKPAAAPRPSTNPWLAELGAPDEGGEEEEGEAEHGEERLTTGADGSVRVEWQPSPERLRRPVALGDALQLSFTWVGPTREVLSRELALPVALSGRSIALELPSQAELPAHAFVPTVTLAAHAALGGEPVGGKPLRLQLYRLAPPAEGGAAAEGGGAKVAAAAAATVAAAGTLGHGAPLLTDARLAELPRAAAPVEGEDCELSSSASAEGARAEACGSDGRGLALPTAGHFALVACELDEPGGKAVLCSALVVGRAAAEWEAAPLGDYLQRALSPALTRPRAGGEGGGGGGGGGGGERGGGGGGGEIAEIALHNPLRTPLRALAAWGSRLGRRAQVVSLPPGRCAVRLPLGAECRGGCRVSLHLAAPTDATRTLPVPVPASPLLDLGGPMLASYALDIDAADAGRRGAADADADADAGAGANGGIVVGVAADKGVAAPGGSVEVTVTLRDAAGRPVEGEAVLVAVDKASLQLRPHPTRDLAAAFAPSLAGAAYHTSDTWRQLASAAGLNHSAAALLAMLAADPWLAAHWPLRPSAGADVELPLRAVLDAHATALTDMPATERPGPEGMVMYAMADEAAPRPMMAMARSAPMMARSAPMLQSRAAPEGLRMFKSAAVANDVEEDSATEADAPEGGGGGGGGGGSVKVRKDFVTTALWLPHLAVGPTGVARVPWTLPDNAGAFELRAYAASGAARLGGGATAEVLVRKRLTLAASAPRIVRVGDRFSCGATLTGSPELAAGSAVQLDLELAQPAAAVAVRGAARRGATLGPGEVVELTFDFEAVALGEAVAVLTVAAADGGAPLDALQLSVPVLGVMPSVTLATSRAVAAAAEPALWAEGLVLPAALPGSGGLTVRTGAGRLPVVRTLAAGLLALPARGAPDARPDALALLASLAPLAMLLPYGGAAEAALPAAAAQLDAAAAALAPMTDGAPGLTGLHYSAAARAAARSTDLRLNAHALFVLRRLRLAGAVLPAALAALGATWRAALGRGLETLWYSEAPDGSREGRSVSVGLLVACRLALGRDWQPTPRRGDSGAAQARLRAAFGVDVLVDASGRGALSTRGQAQLVLLLLLPASPEHDGAGWSAPPPPRALPEPARLALRALRSQLRVSGAHSAYVAASASAWSSAGAADNALVLSALALGARAAKLAGLTIEGASLAINLDKLASHVAAEAPIDASAALAGLALADYDEASGGADADVELRLLAAGAPLYAAHLTTAAPPPPPRTWAWQALPRGPPPSQAPPSPLLFVVEGRGEVSVALALDFIPAAPPTGAVDRGIALLKVGRVARGVARWIGYSQAGAGWSRVARQGRSCGEAGGWVRRCLGTHLICTRMHTTGADMHIAICPRRWSARTTPRRAGRRGRRCGAWAWATS